MSKYKMGVKYNKDKERHDFSVHHTGCNMVDASYITDIIKAKMGDGLLALITQRIEEAVNELEKINDNQR